LRSGLQTQRSFVSVKFGAQLNQAFQLAVALGVRRNRGAELRRKLGGHRAVRRGEVGGGSREFSFRLRMFSFPDFVPALRKELSATSQFVNAPGLAAGVSAAKAVPAGSTMPKTPSISSHLPQMFLPGRMSYLPASIPIAARRKARRSTGIPVVTAAEVIV